MKGLPRLTIDAILSTSRVGVLIAMASIANLSKSAEPLPEPANAPLLLPVISPSTAVPYGVPPTPNSGLSGNFSQSAQAFAAAAIPTTLAAGRTPGTFAVSNSGASTYTIPLTVPPGIGSVQFQMALVYNSRGLDGVLGVGWSLSGMSSITRCNKTWEQDGAPSGVTLTATDRFCLDGQQLKINGSGYSTEIESFSRIVPTGTVGTGPASFTVTTKNGLIYDYGLSSDAQILAGTSGTIRTWALSRIRDRVGNKISFSYTNDTANGTYRIAKITYPTAATGAGPYYEVVFAYVARPTSDVPSGYLNGFAVKEPNELATITIQNYGATTPIKTYNFAYEQGTATNRLRLSAIKECSATNCFPATTIAYQNGQAGWVTAATSLSQTSASPTRILPIDLNGDGISDLVFPVTSGSNYLWYVKYGSSGGVFSAAQSTGVTTTTTDLLVPGDFAGRGQTDLLYPSGSYWYRLYWNGTALATASTGNLINTAQGSSAAATSADINGDGLPDLLWTFNDSFTGGVSRIFVQLNQTPAGGAVSFGAPTSAYTIVSTGNNTFSFIPYGVGDATGASQLTVADFNGDGRADILAHVQQVFSNCPQPIAPPPVPAADPSVAVDSVGTVDSAPPASDVTAATCTTQTFYHWYKLISNGTTLSRAADLAQPFASAHPVLIDWDGDGITDLVSPNSTTGGNWIVLTSTPIDTGIVWTQPILAVDWDGDGRQDIITANGTWKVLRSNGAGVAGALIDTGVAVGSGAWFIGDFNGDGLGDLAWADQLASNTLKLNLHNGAGVSPDLATTFTDGFGMTQSPTYASISRSAYSKYSDAPFPEYDLQSPLYVVDQFTGSDGTGSTYQNQFFYYGARGHKQGRGFEGFYAQRIYDTRNQLYTYDYMQRAFPFTGTFLQRTVVNGTARVLEKTGVPNYQTTGGTGFERRFFPFLASTSEANYEVGGTLDGTVVTQTTVSNTYGDGFGNLTQVVTTTTDKDSGSPYYNLAWQNTVTTGYQNDSTNWCYGLPTTESEQNVVPGQTTQTRSFSYTVDSSVCRITQQDIEPSTAALKVTTLLGFDAAGNISSIAVTGHNPDGSAMPVRTTQFGYGTRLQLPELITNALGQSSSIAYDYTFGVPTLATDLNNVATQWAYEDFGRLSKTTYPDGTFTTRAYTACNSANSFCGVPDLRLKVSDAKYSSSSTLITQSYSYSDGFNRVRDRESARVLGIWTIDEITYFDSLGRRIQRYRPYSSATNGYQKWTYDQINRTKQEQLYNSGGALDRTTGYSYTGRTVSIRDPLGNTVQRVSDVWGRLRKVTDPAPGGTTAYDFDAFGNLVKTTDAIGAVASATYNLRGFRTQMVDPDQGTWNFNADSLNELVSWTDAKSRNFSVVLDLLGRITSRTELEGTSTFTFGTSAANHNIGMLQSMAGYGYSEALAFDSIGRLATRTITTDQTYQFDYSYNSIGQLDTLTYPASPIPSGQTGSRFKVKYDYSYGEVNQISDVTSGTAAVLWTLNAANDYSQATQETFNSSPTVTTVTSGYKAWTAELTSVQAGVGSTSNRQNLAFQWDNAGNLTQRQDLNQSLTENFVPDTLNRLSSTSGASSLSITYDAAGDISSRSDVGTYSYPSPSSAHPHGVTAAGSNSFSYDANGNVSVRNGLTQTWASFNLPTVLQATISGSTFSSAFTYGPEHQRWKQDAVYANGTEQTYYVGGLLEKQIPSTTGITAWRHYIQTPSGLTIIVSRNSNLTTSTTFVLSDHLGSSEALLNKSGALLVRESFGAFGDRRGSNWAGNPTLADYAAIADATRRGFTFHEGLDNIKLIHMNGRVYDPTVGRFMSVDPILASMADSQSINPYAYVGNRPLSYVDPTGYEANCFATGSFTVYCVVISSIVKTAFDWLFGGGQPPPPPPIALQGLSASVGQMPCTPGRISTGCGGDILYENAPTPEGAEDKCDSPSCLFDKPQSAGDFFKRLYQVLTKEPNHVIRGPDGRILRGEDGKPIQIQTGEPPLPGIVSVKSIASALKIARAARSATTLARDATGKIHGVLPKIEELKNASPAQIRENIEELRGSIRARTQELEQLGEHGPHRARIGEEQSLLRSLEGKLEDIFGAKDAPP